MSTLHITRGLPAAGKGRRLVTSILPPTTDAQLRARLICPNCGTNPDQLIVRRIDQTIIAGAVCREGHLFVTEWEASD